MKPSLHELWCSAPLGREIGVARWGTAGRPLILFPTAGGDAREVERFGLVEALAPWVESGAIRIYSCDSVPGKAILSESPSPERFAELLYLFDVFVYHELVPFVRWECGAECELVACGASLGALLALIAVCRHPDVFREAICLSGKYDLSELFDGARPTLDFHFASPLHFLPFLTDEPHLTLLRQRFVSLICGRGRAERPQYACEVARLLGRIGVPNRLDDWGPDWHHEWSTWRATLPRYVSESMASASA